MNFFDYEVAKVWFSNASIHVQLKDGRVASLPVNHFPRLAKASSQQLLQYEIIDGYALHWPDLDEDLSIAGFFENEVETTSIKSAQF